MRGVGEEEDKTKIAS
jgi:TPR repeat protein